MLSREELIDLEKDLIEEMTYFRSWYVDLANPSPWTDKAVHICKLIDLYMTEIRSIPTPTQDSEKIASLAATIFAGDQSRTVETSVGVAREILRESRKIE